MARRPASRLCARRSAPSRQLALNAGEDGSIIVGKMIEKDRPVQLRVRLAGRRIRQLVSKGIIDPTKMVRAAIQNAQLQEDRAEHRGLTIALQVFSQPARVHPVRIYPS
jgi:hypothetical protein